MDTARVDICYRPLRLAWAIRSGDIAAFRKAVRLSYALWGGRFNPIVFADRDEEMRRNVELFRVDVVWPLCDEATANQLEARFLYLRNPFFHGPLFVEEQGKAKRSQLLDVFNAFVHLREKPEWQKIKESGVRLYRWNPTDPLADVLLVQFGDYPAADEAGRDLRQTLIEAAEATEHTFEDGSPISGETQNHVSIPYFSRYGLERHYSVEAGWRWQTAGFFLGDADNLDDLVCHWNLRAADIPLWFVDPRHLGRYAELIPQWEKTSREMTASRREPDGAVGLWSRRAPEEVLEVFRGMRVVVQPVSEDIWNGLNVRVPMMCFESVSTLGVLGGGDGRPKISFALPDKPFSADFWFRREHLVASVRFFSALHRDEHHIFDVPYLPELNEFYAREMFGQYNKLRVEPDRVGLVIDACDSDAWLSALKVSDLTERVFEMAKCRSRMSPAGLILRQLVKRIGGLQGARAFKIPGVRRLIRTQGTTSTFTRDSAVQLIASRDLDVAFGNTDDLFIEGRRVGAELSPRDIFGHLVEKGLFRIGVKLLCPACRLATWVALDTLTQRVVCDLCGEDYDATRQLVDSQWHYRRSGLLGHQTNAQGAIPVALTLQQLDTCLERAMSRGFYSPSLELEFEDQEGPCRCEVDFIWATQQRFTERTAILLAECKDLSPIDAADIDHLRRVADALPPTRFDAYVLLAKLAPFTPDEIENARKLNSDRRKRVILLTHRELEPYEVYARIREQFHLGYVNTPDDLAEATATIYFNQTHPSPSTPPTSAT